jgi:pyruvate formate lyase activating enzyme
VSVHGVGEGIHALDRSRCKACGACVEACSTAALALKGFSATAGDIIDRATRMKPFFEHSGGGVTLTGGEVTTQPEFASAVLAGCRHEGIHTAIETTGACSWSTLARLLEHTDLVLYDLKLMDDVQHRCWTGVSNKSILSNLVKLADLAGTDGGPEVRVRVPLIPEITDTPENLQPLFSFVAGVGIRLVELLPHNPSASAKYEWLDIPYPVEAEAQDSECLTGLAAMAGAAGVEAVVV